MDLITKFLHYFSLKRHMIFLKLKDVKVDEDIDRLFDNFHIQSRRLRSQYLRDAMTNTFILHDSGLSPFSKEYSEFELAEREYRFEKNIFLRGY